MSDTLSVSLWCAFSAATFATPLLADQQQDGDALRALNRMSLEELAKVEVTSVSKSAQPLSAAPASIYVITREEILRSGVLSIPEALRLAPNLQITQLTATDYSNGARGFSGAPDVQNFSNKILILIDGRSVYSPLFSGVTYDALDVLMDDVDRIEVISGPGATLWGANAMNGVINIITRSARETHGTLLRLDAGEGEQALGMRHGAAFGDSGSYRVYAKAFERDSSEFADGGSARDRWQKAQAGFRADLARGAHAFTLQGDYQRSEQNQPGAPNINFSGGNMFGRWDHAGERVHTRVQAYVDHIDRERPPTGIAFRITTYDVELQQSADVGTRHRFVWGAGRRHNDYTVQNTGSLDFSPEHRTLQLTNVFVQDTITLSPEWNLTAGIKFEDSGFRDWIGMPDARLSWSPSDQIMAWAAASRAIRAPTPFDVDVQEFVGGDLFVTGNRDFRPEKVSAFELGMRAQPHPAVSFTLSAFYNEYDDLRTIELTPVTLLPLTWGNLMEGSAYGVEAWANFQITPWWRLSPGFRSLHKRLKFSEGASALVSVRQAGNDPRSRAILKSSMDFGRVTVDAMLRRVGELPDPSLGAYTELQARLAWHATDSLELSLVGFNLLDDAHAEYAAPEGRFIRRSVLAEARWAF